jgi:hypothetical protein
LKTGSWFYPIAKREGAKLLESAGSSCWLQERYGIVEKGIDRGHGPLTLALSRRERGKTRPLTPTLSRGKRVRREDGRRSGGKRGRRRVQRGVVGKRLGR